MSKGVGISNDTNKFNSLVIGGVTPTRNVINLGFAT